MDIIVVIIEKTCEQNGVMVPGMNYLQATDSTVFNSAITCIILSHLKNVIPKPLVLKNVFNRVMSAVFSSFILKVGKCDWRNNPFLRNHLTDSYQGLDTTLESVLLASNKNFVF